MDEIRELINKALAKTSGADIHDIGKWCFVLSCWARQKYEKGKVLTQTQQSYLDCSEAAIRAYVLTGDREFAEIAYNQVKQKYEQKVNK